MTPQPSDQRTRPRKQPSQARAHHTVGAIVEAAARILEDAGHRGFTTNAVAELAGVSIGTLYQYFPDKDALLGALLARETGRLLDEVASTDDMGSGHDALGRVIDAAIRHQTRRPRLAQLLDFEEARLPGDGATTEVRRSIGAQIAGILTRPDLPAQPDVEVAAADVLAILRGLIDAAGERGENKPDILARRVRRAVFGYLVTPS